MLKPVDRGAEHLLDVQSMSVLWSLRTGSIDTLIDVFSNLTHWIIMLDRNA